MQSLDECYGLSLLDICEPDENSLRLVVQELKILGPAEDLEVSGHTITGLERVDSDATCRLFELLWDSYVAYCVRNESYCTLDREEPWQGRLFRHYTQSKFLDFVGRATFVTVDYPGAFAW